MHITSAFDAHKAAGLGLVKPLVMELALHKVGVKYRVRDHGHGWEVAVVWRRP